MANPVIAAPAQSISLEQAKPEKLFYVVANVVVYRQSDGRCLLLKRHDRERVHPGLYGVIGGKAEWRDYDLTRPSGYHGEVAFFSDVLENLLVREVGEEAGIEIQPKPHYLNSVMYVRSDGMPTMLVKFCAEYKSGDVVIEQGSFSDFMWVNEREVTTLPCIGGIAEEVAETIRYYKQEEA